MIDSIGSRLREERERLGLTQEQFAQLTPASTRQSQSNYEKDARTPDALYLNAVATLGADVLYILTGGRRREGAPPRSDKPSIDGFVLVPRYDVKASAGHGSLVHSEQVVDHLAFREEWVRNALGVAEKDLALITVRGDSMEPTLSNGDLILIDTHRQTIGENSIYVIRYDGELLVKRAQRRLDGTIVIKSDNVAYEPEVVEPKQVPKLGVIGRVVWAGRRL